MSKKYRNIIKTKLTNTLPKLNPQNNAEKNRLPYDQLPTIDPDTDFEYDPTPQFQFAGETESFVTSKGIILFVRQYYPGMVGETYEQTDACLISEKLECTKIDYENVKSLYKLVQYSKQARMSYWSWMKSMSPEEENAESERSYREAISKVI